MKKIAWVMTVKDYTEDNSPLSHILHKTVPVVSIKNIAKGTTGPRVEFISQVAHKS